MSGWCCSCLDGVEVFLRPACREFKSDLTHITSCRNVISIEQMATAAFWIFLAFRKGSNFVWFSYKKINCIHKLTNKIIFFSKFKSSSFSKIFSNFAKFQPRYSYKMISLQKQKSLIA